MTPDPIDPADHAADVFSTNGEDGILAYLFEVLAERDGGRACLEVGPGDGLHGLTTAWWGFKTWRARLIEPDPDACLHLIDTASRVDGYRDDIQTTSDMSIRTAGGLIDITRDKPTQADLTPPADAGSEWDLAVLNPAGSIHYLPWISLGAEPWPRVLVVRYNETLPWWMNIRGTSALERVGASAGAYIDDLRPSHTLVAVAGDRLVFVRNDQRVERRAAIDVTARARDIPTIDEVALDPADLFDLPAYVVATDFDGNTLVVGEPPYGFSQEPCTAGIEVYEPRTPPWWARFRPEPADEDGGE